MGHGTVIEKAPIIFTDEITKLPYYDSSLPIFQKKSCILSECHSDHVEVLPPGAILLA